MKGRGKLALAGALLALAIVPAATAATIRVNDNALPAGCVGAFPTIQAGVYAANPGDTIIVCAGYYNESVVVNKSNLIIRAQNRAPDLTTCGATRTAVNSPAFPNRPYSVVQGTGFTSFTVAADRVTLDGFVIQGPNGGSAPGIYTVGAFGGQLIQNNLVQDNAGGLLFDSNGTVQSKATANCFRQNNDVNSYSGETGIYAGSAVNTLVASNRFFGHTREAGLWDDAGGTPPSKVAVSANISTNDAGGFSITESTSSSFSSNIIKGNTTHGFCIGPANVGLAVQSNIVDKDTGFGILFDDFCSPTAFASGANTGAKFLSNIVTSTDAGFYVSGDNQLQNSTITSNIVKSTANTAMWVTSTGGNGGNFGNKFTANIATGAGPGFFGCRDDTMGPPFGTAGTANTWGNSNIGKPNNSPPALCFPNK